MGLRTAASLKAATTIQIDRVSRFFRCFEVTVRPYQQRTTIPTTRPTSSTAPSEISSTNDNAGLSAVSPKALGGRGTEEGRDGTVRGVAMPKSRRPLLVCRPSTTEKLSRSDRQGCTGLRSTHRIASNKLTGRPKRFAKVLDRPRLAPSRRRI
jgi:hypothetical protein